MIATFSPLRFASSAICGVSAGNVAGFSLERVAKNDDTVAEVAGDLRGGFERGRRRGDDFVARIREFRDHPP